MNMRIILKILVWVFLVLLRNTHAGIRPATRVDGRVPLWRPHLPSASLGIPWSIHSKAPASPQRALDHIAKRWPTLSPSQIKLLSAVVARAVTVAVFYPLDTQRTLRQAGKQSSENEHWSRSYKGIIPNLLFGEIPYCIGSKKLTEFLVPRIQNQVPGLSPQLVKLCASLTTELVGTAWSTPNDNLKKHMQLSGDSSVLSAVNKSDLFTVTGWTVARRLVSRAVQSATLESIVASEKRIRHWTDPTSKPWKDNLVKLRSPLIQRKSGPQDSTVKTALFTAVSGAAGGIAARPLDALRIHQQLKPQGLRIVPLDFLKASGAMALFTALTGFCQDCCRSGAETQIESLNNFMAARREELRAREAGTIASLVFRVRRIISHVGTGSSSAA